MMTMRWLLCTLAAFVLFPSAANAQAAEEKFRGEMMPRIAAAMPGATITTKSGDPLAVYVKGGPWGDEEAQINLDRIFVYCQNVPAEDCEAEKAKFVSSISKAMAPATPASLRLVVRDQDYIDSIRAMFSQNAANKKPDSPVIEPLGGGLYAVLVSDSPDALQILTGGSLKDMGLTPAQAWDIAKRQTAPLLPPIPKASELKATAVMLSDHEFGGSVLIDLPAWAKLAKEVGPDLFVTVVADQTVFIAVMPDGPTFESFKESVVEDCRAQPRCISPFIYRFRNGRWAIAD